MKYKVFCSGFYIVEADNDDEAQSKDKEIDGLYAEESIDSVEELDDGAMWDWK